ncbi:MAG: iron ABC transporter permease [Muribaculaceae bacterium]|nr:iron ABC transporter permease [Muribaculaceae bacterium]
MSKHRNRIIFILLIVVLLILVASNMIFGAVDIPASAIFDILCGNEVERPTWSVIILESRIPMIITAALSGCALSVAGLLLQTVFNNPLAGPSILGVSTGASLGVAIIMLSLGTSLGSTFGISTGGFISILAGAFIGAFAVLAILLIFSSFLKSTTMLLIVGILVSYITSSAISLLNFFSTQEGVHSYVIWGLGSFSGVAANQIPLFAFTVAIALLWALAMTKPLNALLLGARYASNLGVNVKSVRNKLLIITGLLTAIVTAYCGPIGFIGLVVPHIARLLLNTSNHNTLLPATILCGAVVALLCTLISILPDNGILPINAITPIIGVPIILYIILNRRKIHYFN